MSLAQIATAVIYPIGAGKEGSYRESRGILGSVVVLGIESVPCTFIESVVYGVNDL